MTRSNIIFLAGSTVNVRADPSVQFLLYFDHTTPSLYEMSHAC